MSLNFRLASFPGLLTISTFLSRVDLEFFFNLLSRCQSQYSIKSFFRFRWLLVQEFLSVPTVHSLQCTQLFLCRCAQHTLTVNTIHTLSSFKLCQMLFDCSLSWVREIESNFFLVCKQFLLNTHFKIDIVRRGIINYLQALNEPCVYNMIYTIYDGF